MRSWRPSGLAPPATAEAAPCAGARFACPSAIQADAIWCLPPLRSAQSERFGKWLQVAGHCTRDAPLGNKCCLRSRWFSGRENGFLFRTVGRGTTKQKPAGTSWCGCGFAFYQTRAFGVQQKRPGQKRPILLWPSMFHFRVGLSTEGPRPRPGCKALWARVERMCLSQARQENTAEYGGLHIECKNADRLAQNARRERCASGIFSLTTTQVHITALSWVVVKLCAKLLSMCAYVLYVSVCYLICRYVFLCFLCKCFRVVCCTVFCLFVSLYFVFCACVVGGTAPFKRRLTESVVVLARACRDARSPDLHQYCKQLACPSHSMLSVAWRASLRQSLGMMIS